MDWEKIQLFISPPLVPGTHKARLRLTIQKTATFSGALCQPSTAETTAPWEHFNLQLSLTWTEIASEMFWFHDQFWNQAYGVEAPLYGIETNTTLKKDSKLSYEDIGGQRKVTLAPGKSFSRSRRLLY